MFNIILYFFAGSLIPKVGLDDEYVDSGVFGLPQENIFKLRRDKIIV